MKRTFTISKRLLFAISAILLAAMLVTACGSSSDLTKSTTQREFGVRMARMNLWREALFRFRRAVDITPADAMSHNNLAVAYEANGDFDNAAREYREAMRLDKSNTYIQKNYSRFVEFTSRNKKRQGAPKPAGAAITAPAATTPAIPPASESAPPAPDAPAPVPQPNPRGAQR